MKISLDMIIFTVWFLFIATMVTGLVYTVHRRDVDASERQEYCKSLGGLGGTYKDGAYRCYTEITDENGWNYERGYSKEIPEEVWK